MNWKRHKYEQRNFLAIIQDASRQEVIEFDLSDQGLTEIPEAIGRLTNLRCLDISGNHLSELPNAISDLIQLESLNLSNNDLIEIPENLGNLKNLEDLDISRNQLSSIPAELGRLENLIQLDLSSNKLAKLSRSIGQLVNLEELRLSDNQLTSLPKELSQLTNLTRLDLSQNQLMWLPQELGQLTNLTQLDFFGNQLTTVPPELGQLVNLKGLSLHQNQLMTVPPELGQLANLTWLSLHENRLTALPLELGQLDNLTALYLHDNEKLKLSSEIIGPTLQEVIFRWKAPANPQDILNYYFSIQTACQTLNEAKLILVGFGAVGKTSLVNRLLHNTFDPNSKKTQGIQIAQWPITLNGAEDIKLHVWDFGGQEIMHSTHQFFLTERSLYLLVLNGRQGHEDADAEYWLELIQSFGNNSPVIVILNKIKDHAFDVNRRALQEKFPAIREFIRTDCEAEIGIDQLRTAIERETDRLEHLRAAFPASWVTIKNQLAEMTDNYISFEKYREICQQDGETDVSAQDSLAVHLHSLGIALNYKDDPRLRDTHVLNPHWVTNGIYTLLNAHELADTNGELALDCLGRTLDPKNYPRARHGFLIDLMRKFELCFRFEEDDNRYLIPDLLDKQQPPEASEFKPTDCLNFRYEYPILPEGLLPRFIVRTHVLSDHQLRWRTGVILTFEDNRALVKADPQDRCVTINVTGPVASRRRLLAVIRSDFDRIHSSFKFKPKELVPVPGHPTVTVSYKELLAREKQGRQSFDVFLGDEDLLELNVQDLLSGVDIEGSRQRPSLADRHECPLRLFYSYSHKDETLRDQLDTHLKILERQQLIQPWHDRRIDPGDDWAQDIDNNLNQADIILLLVSADFISSRYCYEIELPHALQRHQSGDATVIPIIIRPVDWQASQLSALGVLPTDGKAVTQWRDRDAAWLDVETGIKRAVEAIKGKGYR